MRRTWIAIAVLSAACGGGASHAPPSPPVSHAPAPPPAPPDAPTDPLEAAALEMEQIAKKMCACGDSTCANALYPDAVELSKTVHCSDLEHPCNAAALKRYQDAQMKVETCVTNKL